jgi:cold shock CspA family protein
MPTQTDILSINSNINLEPGEKLVFKLQNVSNTSNNFTASLGAGNATILTVASLTGYATTVAPFISGSGTIGTNQVVLSSGVTEFYGGTYTYLPNPGGGTESSLYASGIDYSDVDNTFVINPFDIFLLYLSNNTYIESKILNISTSSGYLTLTLDTPLTVNALDDIANQTYKRLLILSRKPDETNVILNFAKKDGKTSYGFLIPENLEKDILAKIDTITREIKQKLINDQTIIDNISSGGGTGTTF